MKKLIFGGAFNPIHNGHLNSVQTIIQKFNFDQALVIPTAKSPLKNQNQEVSTAQRVDMLELAFRDIERVALDDRELLREGTSYTVDTLLSLVDENPGVDFSLMIGMDQLEQFDQWKDFEEILSLADLIVTTRPGYSTLAFENLPVSVRELVEKKSEDEIQLVTGKKIHLVRLNDINISATELRTAIQNSDSISEFVPPSIDKYISKNKLYKAGRKKLENYEELTRFCGQFLFDRKAIRVKAFDVREINQPAEFNIVTSGTSTRHAISLAENLITAVRERFGLKPQNVDGLSEGRWIVVDYGSLIFHVFYDYLREAYRMEELWKDGVDLELVDTSIKE